MVPRVKCMAAQSVGHRLNNRMNETDRPSQQVLAAGNSTTRCSWSAAVELGYNLQHHAEIPHSVVDGYEQKTNSPPL